MKDERTKLRPIPSGKVSVNSALIFAISLISFGLFSAWYFYGLKILFIFSLFVVLNLVFTFFLKKVPFIEIVINSLTHPLRVILGIVFIDAQLPLIFFVVYFFFILGLAVRIREIKKQSRGSEHRLHTVSYTNKQIASLKIISFILLLTFALVDGGLHRGWYLLIICFYIVFVSDLSLFKPFRYIFKRVYLSG